MKGLYSFFSLLLLIAIALIGVQLVKWHFLFGVIIPYLAVAIFIIGIIYRVVKWAKSPVPFRITTTCGQQKTLPWIKSSRFDNPSNLFGTLVRMAMEILFFRSLFRNTKADIKDGKIVYGGNKWLWLGGLAFHWTFLIVLLRHFRFFTEPTPFFVSWIQNLDGLLQIGVPVMYMTDVILLGALTYLFLRRVIIPQVRYISLASDYFPLFLIMAIGTTGVLMRYVPSMKVDIIAVKELTLGLIGFSPVVPEGIGATFFIHLFLVSLLLAYFPISKLMHMGGVFLSPTRNLANNNRARRHVNPWDYPVKGHSYEEWEDEFRELMKDCGLPLEKEE
ncbi:MAG: menaquinol oxidoreductase [Candidatus Zixiibacteriota bacterium]|nr:MAG: menaquinol oxidoreductase [candidate division Zixibacteria bacterium]HDL03313.1 menaquinol oxidoreductase [candidate division Zixibacteria bacterium]